MGQPHPWPLPQAVRAVWGLPTRPALHLCQFRPLKASLVWAHVVEMHRTSWVNSAAPVPDPHSDRRLQPLWTVVSHFTRTGCQGDWPGQSSAWAGSSVLEAALACSLQLLSSCVVLDASPKSFSFLHLEEEDIKEAKCRAIKLQGCSPSAQHNACGTKSRGL